VLEFRGVPAVSGVAPSLRGVVFLHLAIHRDRYKPVGSHIPELDDSVPISRKLTPAARLFRVLLDGRIRVSFHVEGHCPEALLTGAADWEPLAFGNW